MKSMVRKLLVVAAIAALSMACVAVDVASKCADFMVDRYRAGSDWLGAFVIKFSTNFATDSPGERLPRTAFTRAKSFMARIVKRERPVIRPTFRMCPSI